MYPVVNNSYQANQDALAQVCIWDQTPNKLGRVVMPSLRDPEFPAGNQYSFITRSNHLLMEMNMGMENEYEINGGWIAPRRLGVTRVFVLLRESLVFDIDSIEKNIRGAFQVKFKHFI